MRVTPTPNHDQRTSGIPSTGNLPWGSHFCQFYRTKKDLLDVLVPYFRAGLENNESCVWVTPKLLRIEDAENALEKAAPGYRTCAAMGQMEIVPVDRWLARGGKTGKAFLSRLDKAIAGGFDGLRLACDAAPDGTGGKNLIPYWIDAVRGNNVIAAFAYPKGAFDALGLMEVIKNHRFALVRNAGRWEVIESSEARTVKDELKRSEEKFKSLFSNMSEGFAYHRIVLDARGRPSDYIFLEVNDAFERLVGLKRKDVIGKRVTAALPGMEKDRARWIAKYGKVASTGKPIQFESFSETLDRWYTVSAFSPHKGYFAVTFSDITKRKRAEETSRRSLRRFEILADTAGELLRTHEPQKVVESICGRVMNQIGCHVFFNFLADEKTGKLHLNAFEGIPEEEARRIEWLEYGVAVCGCIGRDGRPVIAEHVPTTPDERTELVKSYGVKAYACHPLLEPGGNVIGTLSFGTRGRETFSNEELSLMKAVTDHVAMAMTRIRAEEALKASLADKDVLMRELAHRTKNNMQVIGSLLSLQAAASADRSFTTALADTQDRIRAMALVHENLYRSGNIASLNLKDYVDDLVNSLLRAHRGIDAPIRAVLDIDDLFITIDAALPCGLIINELISNSLKHAFPDRDSGTIFLSLHQVGERVELRYRDDGPGLPRSLDLSHTKTLGLKLVYNLAVRQLRGTMDVKHDPSTEFMFTFGGFNQMERT